MSVPAFVDTSVLVYADDRANPPKQRRVQDLIPEWPSPTRPHAARVSRVSARRRRTTAPIHTRREVVGGAMLRAF